MDVSYLSLLLFLLVTGVYFMFVKVPMGVSILKDSLELGRYRGEGYRRAGLYFMAVLFSQFILNIVYLVGECGGSVGGNIWVSAAYTFVPWTFLFGSVIVSLIAFPGLKSAFSDVVGYFTVASSANLLLSSLLVDTDVSSLIDKSDGSTASKNSQRRAAEAIMKLCGNKSILINQIRPDNFLSMWELLLPLMKPLSASELSVKQNELLKLVSLRENVGEAMWYIYSAILVSSIVYYNLAGRGCTKSLKEIEESRAKYLLEQEKVQSNSKLNDSVTYTIG